MININCSKIKVIGDEIIKLTAYVSCHVATPESVISLFHDNNELIIAQNFFRVTRGEKESPIARKNHEFADETD